VSKRKEKGKAEGADGEKPGAVPTVSLASHPRAHGAMRRVRARCAIGAFVLVAYLSHRSGVPGPDMLLRGLIGGLVAFFATWACGVTVYRQVVLAELRHAEEAWRERMKARAAEVERINAERAAQAAELKAARA
jgi:hypothetical protein